MPELPEVETVRRGLETCLVGSSLKHIHVLGKLREPLDEAELETFCTGRTVTAVRRRAKYLLVVFSEGDGLLLHLGMTGSFRIDTCASADERHCRVCWELADGRIWRFNDIRCFGMLRICREDISVATPACLAELGPEPLEDVFSADYLWQTVRGRKTAIKECIMDQKLVVGVGNIYASESLFRAGISPKLAAGRLTKVQVSRLVDSIRQVLTESIAAGGTTISDFRTLDGSEGGFSVSLRVYGRQGEPCLNCGTPIERIVQGGRSTFFCPACQRISRSPRSSSGLQRCR